MEFSHSNSEISVMGSVPIKYQKRLIRVIYMTNVTVEETELGLRVHITSKQNGQKCGKRCIKH